MLRQLFLTITVIMILSSAILAEAPESFKQFNNDYKALDAEILKYISEKVEVTNFVYQKDLATFTFKSGTFYLLRHIQNRPTAAIFIGEGNCKIDPEILNEKQSLLWCSGKDVVDEDFESCFIRFGDDLDLALANFPHQEHEIKWKEFNTYKQSQGEYYFRPVTSHEYDNYFQLLRSVYDRQADGYFWIDFNRYVYRYDPSLPEQTVIAYEHEGGQFAISDAVSLTKISDTEKSSYSLSNQIFPTTLISRTGMLRLTGMSGEHIKEAAIKMQLKVNRDDLQYLSLFLHFNLEIDSIIYKQQKCNFWRRGSFTFTGVMLPEIIPAGSTFDLTIFYHGKDYSIGLPFVKDPAPSTINFDLYGSSDFDYFAPGKSAPQEAEGRFNKFTFAPEHPYRHFYFQAVAEGFDTLVKITSSGTEINFLKSDRFSKKYSARFTPDEDFENAIIQSFDFFSPRLGSLPTSETLFVYPDSTITMPGLIEFMQLADYEDQTGELHVRAAHQVARQWFGAQMKPASDRELWVANAFPDYLGLRFALETAGARPFFTQLNIRKQIIERAIEIKKNMPPGAGDRASVAIRTAKGSWIVHMLRYLMYNPEKPSEIDFLKFVRESAQRSNQALFTNQDLRAIAEKYYGQPLDWFFDQWLFDFIMPQYSGSWSTEKRNDAYFINLELITSKTNKEYQMPLWFRVALDDNNLYFHENTRTGPQTFEFGPFDTEPTDLIINEFMSVLCQADISKK